MGKKGFLRAYHNCEDFTLTDVAVSRHAYERMKQRGIRTRDVYDPASNVAKRVGAKVITVYRGERAQSRRAAEVWPSKFRPQSDLRVTGVATNGYTERAQKREIESDKGPVPRSTILAGIRITDRVGAFIGKGGANIKALQAVGEAHGVKVRIHSDKQLLIFGAQSYAPITAFVNKLVVAHVGLGLLGSSPAEVVAAQRLLESLPVHFSASELEQLRLLTPEHNSLFKLRFNLDCDSIRGSHWQARAPSARAE